MLTEEQKAIKDAKRHAAEELAHKLSEALKTSDIQICNYSKRFIIRKGSAMVARGDSLYINGKGPAFLIGSFRAYTA